MNPKVQIVIIASTPPCDKCAACKKMAQDLAEKYGPAVHYQVLDALDPADTPRFNPPCGGHWLNGSSRRRHPPSRERRSFGAGASRYGASATGITLS